MAHQLARLAPRFKLSPTDETTGGPSKYWRAEGYATRIGFITPHSHNFCASCNRVRVTARGDLYPCLGQNDAIRQRLGRRSLIRMASASGAA